MKFIVYKTLVLEFRCEANSQQEAEEQCIEASELEMNLYDCQYEVEVANA